MTDTCKKQLVYKRDSFLKKRLTLHNGSASADPATLDSPGNADFELILLQAICSNDSLLLDQLLSDSEKTVDNWQDKEGRPLLECALRTGTVGINIIKTLLHHGADVSSASPLMWALETKRPHKNRLEIIQELLNAGTRMMFYSEYAGELKSTALHETFRAANDKWTFCDIKMIMEEYLDRGLDIETRDLMGFTILLAVVEKDGIHEENFDIRRRDMQIIEWLISHGADVNTMSYMESTPLSLSVANGDLERVELLINAGTKADSVNSAGQSLMWHLHPVDDEAKLDCLDIAKKLIVGGCNVNQKCIDGSTALSLVIQEGQPLLEVIECLLLHGAAVNEPDFCGRTPLHHALSLENQSPRRLIETLLRYGANIDATDVHCYTALHVAALTSNSSGMLTLLEHGAAVNIRGHCGITVMHLAAENGDVAMIKSLLEKGDLLNVRDKYGATPLHYAAANCNGETAEELLRLGADHQLVDNDGHSALWHAEFNSRKTTSWLLKNCSESKLPTDLPLYVGELAKGEAGICKHFNEVGEILLNCSCMYHDNVSEVLANISRLKRTEFVDEAARIRDKLDNFVDELLAEVVAMESYFTGHMFRCGSSREGVKIGFPNEYDYMWIFDKFTDGWLYMDEDINVGYEGFAKLRIKSDVMVDESLKQFQFIPEDGFIDANKVLKRFHSLLQTAYFQIASRHSDSLYFASNLRFNTDSFFSRSPIVKGKLPCLDATWRGTTYKFLNITYDIVPTIHLDCWSSKAISSCSALPSTDIKQFGTYLVPKDAPSTENFSSEPKPLGQSMRWRMSFSHVELALMHSIPECTRLSYVLAKSFREEPLACAVGVLSGAVETQVSDYMETDSNDTLTGSETMDTGSENGSEDACRFNHLTDICSSSSGHADDFNGDAAKIEYADDDWIEPTSLLPSYCFKMLLFDQVEQLAQQKQMTSPHQLAVELYQKMKLGLERNDIRSFFIPTQNLFSLYHEKNFGKSNRDLRIIYIDQILKLMERLHFTDKQIL